jgi:hypothetical protein
VAGDVHGVAVVIIVRSFRFAGGLRLAWMLFGIAFLLTAVGDTLWVLYESVWEIEPFPSMPTSPISASIR